MLETLVSFTGPHETPSGWTRLPDFPLGTVHSHSIAIHGSNLYVLTGIVNDQLDGKMLRFSFLTNQWEEVTMRGGPAVATHGHSLYMLSGSINRWGGVGPNNDFIKQGYNSSLTTGEISWAPRATATVATEGQVVIPVGQISLTVGGRASTGFVKTVQHQQSNGVVKNIRDLDLPAVYKSDGGLYGQDAYIYPYDDNQLIIMRGANNPTATKQWEYKPKRPFRHIGNTFTNIGQSFYLFGNLYENNDHTGFERYDLLTDTWSMIKDTIPLRHSHAATKYGNLLIVVGGVVDGVPTNEVWAFDTTTIK